MLTIHEFDDGINLVPDEDLGTASDHTEIVDRQWTLAVGGCDSSSSLGIKDVPFLVFFFIEEVQQVLDPAVLEDDIWTHDVTTRVSIVVILRPES